MKPNLLRISSALIFFGALLPSGVHAATAEERKVDPTFLRRSIASVATQSSELSTPSCRYKPLFGAGDSQAKELKGIARFGEITVDSGGESKSRGLCA